MNSSSSMSVSGIFNSQPCNTLADWLSPKSNTAEISIDKALEDLENYASYEIPPHILNREIKGGAVYKYPHDYPDDFIKQQYLPNSLFDRIYYEGKETGKYERALKERNEYLRSILKKR